MDDEGETLTVTAWANGNQSRKSTAYGLKIRSREDRDKFFKRSWGTVALRIADLPMPIRVNIDKDSFWNDTCRELIAKEIGQWMLKTGLASWERGRPPRFILCADGEGVFDVEPAGEAF